MGDSKCYKLVHEVSDMTSLRELIVQELKHIGIKFRDKLKNESKTIIAKRGLFGEPLLYLNSLYVEDIGVVPKFVVDLGNIVKKYINTEGLFRKPGCIMRQKELKELVDSGRQLPMDTNPHDACSLLKLFLREMPEPIIPFIFQDVYLKINELKPDSKKCQALVSSILLLPLTHIVTLRYILQLLLTVDKENETNLMNKCNLSRVFAPNIFRTSTNSLNSMTCATSELMSHIALVELMIEYADSIGIVNMPLLMRLSLLNKNADKDSVDIKNSKYKLTKAESINCKSKLEKETIDDASQCYESMQETCGSKQYSTMDSKYSKFYDGFMKKKKKSRRSASFKGMIDNLSNSFNKWLKDGKSVGSGNLSKCDDEYDSNSLYTVASDPCLNKIEAEKVQNNNILAAKKHINSMDSLDSAAAPVIKLIENDTGKDIRMPLIKRNAILRNLPSINLHETSSLLKTPKAIDIEQIHKPKVKERRKSVRCFLRRFSGVRNASIVCNKKFPENPPSEILNCKSDSQLDNIHVEVNNVKSPVSTNNDIVKQILSSLETPTLSTSSNDTSVNLRRGRPNKCGNGLRSPNKQRFSMDPNDFAALKNSNLPSIKSKISLLSVDSVTEHNQAFIEPSDISESSVSGTSIKENSSNDNSESFIKTTQANECKIPDQEIARKYNNHLMVTPISNNEKTVIYRSSTLTGNSISRKRTNIELKDEKIPRVCRSIQPEKIPNCERLRHAAKLAIIRKSKDTENMPIQVSTTNERIKTSSSRSRQRNYLSQIPRRNV